MKRYDRSVWKGIQYGKVQQVSIERYSVWKCTAGQHGKVEQVSMERYNRSI